MTRGRLLLVEDDRALAERLAWHFERQDFQVRHTADGEQALALNEGGRPDIIRTVRSDC